MAEKRDNSNGETKEREIVIMRVIHAPRELVWKAWTEPEHLIQWWGPRGFTTTFQTIDIKPDGVWKGLMHSPDGKDYPFQVVYKEVVKPERLVYSHSSGNNNHSSDFDATITFEAQGDKTKLTMYSIFPSPAARDRHVKIFKVIEGGNQMLDRLEEQLALLQTENGAFTLTRVFNAPRELVWKTFTNPEHMKQWWGPKGFTVRVAKMDFRPGGMYHYCLRSPDGHDMWGKFVYREIVPPEKLILIDSFSDEKGGLTHHPMSPTWPSEMLTTFLFTEKDGKTTFALTWIPFNSSVEERKTFDEGRASMTQGWTGTMDQLTEYLGKIQK